MTTQPRKGTYVNYQARASAFHVGDSAFPLFGGNHSNSGTVVAVFPAIGMVDLQFPHGNARYPVEDLVLDNVADDENVVSLLADTVPGGAGTVSVSGGPPVRQKTRLAKPIGKSGTPKPTPKVFRVAAAYVKRAVYWASVDRKYKPSKEELRTGNLCCPRCEDAYLRTTVYKREGGKSTKLFCCPKCLFLLRRDDVIGMEG